MVQVKEATLTPLAFCTPAYEACPKILEVGGNLKKKKVTKVGEGLTAVRCTESSDKYKTLKKIKRVH